MSDTSVGAQRFLDAGRAKTNSNALSVEIVMDSHRIIGELGQADIPRRLVDILNSVDGAFIVVHNGRLDDPFFDEGDSHDFETMQVQINTILFAIPHSPAPVAASSFETISKVPVPATIVLPGFEVRGQIHLLPDTDPAQTPMLGGRRFVPLTNVTIVPASGRSRTWREDVVVVNLARAILYAPHDRAR